MTKHVVGSNKLNVQKFRRYNYVDWNISDGHNH
jgi:hypothetical protein